VQRTSYEIAHCVVCGQHDAAIVADAAELRSEVEALWEYHARRLRSDTPTPRLADRLAFSEPPPLRLVRCVDCGLVYRNPIERASEVKSFYARGDAARDGLAAMHASQLPTARIQARRIRRLLGRGGTGLELGSYVGAFLAAARESGLSFDGIDVNPTINAFVRGLGLRVHDGELHDHRVDSPLDVLAIWNTFDQLADPRGVAFDAWRRVRPGGLLAVRVPNGAFYARLHRALTTGDRMSRRIACAMMAQNNLLGFPYRWGFTVRSLERLLSDVGFAVVDVHGDVLVRTSDEWTLVWARWEERLLKRTMAAVVRSRPSWAPWLEILARRTSTALGGKKMSMSRHA
jgi:Methyltransferase domain